MASSVILRVRLPLVLNNALEQQAHQLRVEKPDLARIVIARGLLGLEHDTKILPLAEDGLARGVASADR
jgi:hypothetical protein